jgi:hypothetical protein
MKNYNFQLLQIVAGRLEKNLVLAYSRKVDLEWEVEIFEKASAL